MSFLSKLISSISASGRTVSKRTVGIDIGSSSIKVIELEERENVLTLTSYGELQLGPYNAKEVGQSVVLDPKKEQQALVDVLRESAVKAKQAVFAMPLSASFVTVMSLETNKVEDLGGRVRVEARKYIPAQISEVTLDWAEVASGNDGATQEVLVAAIQNTALQRFNSLLEFVGFVKPPTEIECFSAIRSVYSEAEEHLAIIDIGAVSTKLYIAKSGLLQRMHRVRAGGALATVRLAEVMQLSFEEAEIKKRTVNTTDSDYRDVIRAHRSCFERPFGEFRQVIDEYERTLGVKIGAVYAIGGEMLFQDVRSQMKEILQKEVLINNPFSKVAFPAFMEDVLKEIGSTFTVSMGAALRAFD